MVSPQQAKVSAMASFYRPITKKDVRSFLGLAGYYRRYIPNSSVIAAPLSDLTSKLDPEKAVWTEECQYVFDKLKLALTTNPTLAPPDYDRPFLLQTDASDRGIGVVLSQDYDGKERPVAYYSRKLLPRERRYAATDKEGLAVVSACKHFLPYLIGRRFTGLLLKPGTRRDGTGYPVQSLLKHGTGSEL